MTRNRIRVANLSGCVPKILALQRWSKIDFPPVFQICQMHSFPIRKCLFAHSVCANFGLNPKKLHIHYVQIRPSFLSLIFYYVAGSRTWLVALSYYAWNLLQVNSRAGQVAGWPKNTWLYISTKYPALYTFGQLLKCTAIQICFVSEF